MDCNSSALELYYVVGIISPIIIVMLTIVNIWLSVNTVKKNETQSKELLRSEKKFKIHWDLYDYHILKQMDSLYSLPVLYGSVIKKGFEPGFDVVELGHNLNETYQQCESVINTYMVSYEKSLGKKVNDCNESYYDEVCNLVANLGVKPNSRIERDLNYISSNFLRKINNLIFNHAKKFSGAT